MPRHSLTTALLLATLTLSSCAIFNSDPGWVTLFDGTSLAEFDSVGDANWRIEHDYFVADKLTGKNQGFLVSKKSYKDFQLRAEFFVSDNANSGIYMRCADAKLPTDKTCYEANIFDQRPDPAYGTGAITHLYKVVNMPKAGGRWNTYDITVKGTRIVVLLNGNQTADLTDGKLASGPFAIQYAAGVVRFRKIEIKELQP